MSKTIEQLKAEILEKAAARKAAIAQRIETAKLTRELALLSDDRNLATIERIESANENLVSLNTIATTMNDLAPITLKGADVRTVSVNVYPVAKSVFGDELSRVIGIVEAVDSALDDHKFEMLAISGLEPALVTQTAEAIGRRPYYSKRDKAVIAGHIGDAEVARTCLELCINRMELNPINLDTVTQDALKSLHDYAFTRAENQLAMQEELNEIDKLAV